MGTLTDDADLLICLMYENYLDSRRNGKPKLDSKMFGSSKNIRDKFLPKWDEADIDETCRELSRASFLDCLFSDNHVSQTALTDKAIVYMENRFENKVENLIGWISKLRALLPF